MWNSKLDVYRTGWLDLVFADRNKAYGAYELRQHNNRTTIKALLTASGLTVSIILAMFLYSKRNIIASSRDITPLKDIVVKLSRVTEHKLPQQALPKTRKAPAVKPLPVNSKKFINLRVVSSIDVSEEPVTIEELKTSVIGSTNTGGTSNGSQALELTAAGGNGSGDSPASTGNELVPADLLEKYPEFPGGERAFAKYLSRNLKYPYSAAESNITGRVWVSFIIERNGTLSNIKVVRGIGGGCDEEAVRVLKKAPAWSPGVQNGRPVRVAYTIPIHFQLSQ